MNKIFISYRRSDNPDLTDRFYEKACERFGMRNIFYDQMSISLGQDYISRMMKEASQASIMVVMIGPNWQSQRLQNIDDPVRKEIEVALQHHVKILPILMGERTKMPTMDDLPQSLKELHKFNGIHLGSGFNFKRDINHVLKEIDKVKHILEEDHSLSTLLRIWRFINRCLQLIQFLYKWTLDISQSLPTLFSRVMISIILIIFAIFSFELGQYSKEADRSNYRIKQRHIERPDHLILKPKSLELGNSPIVSDLKNASELADTSAQHAEKVRLHGISIRNRNAQHAEKVRLHGSSLLKSKKNSREYVGDLNQNKIKLPIQTRRHLHNIKSPSKFTHVNTHDKNKPWDYLRYILMVIAGIGYALRSK